MGDRTVEIEQESLETTTPATLRLLAEIVLGVRNSHLSAYERAYLDVAEEMCNRVDPEGNVSIEIPAASVVQRTAWEAYGDCATYFTCVRDSLRNILLDIAKRVEQRDLIYSDKFWEKFILKAVETKKTETLLWDFKETLTLWHVKHDPEKLKAKVTLAEDVVSLANARGGALVIGVTDHPREIVGVGNSSRDVENRLNIARQVIAKLVEYDRDLVLFRQIIIPGLAGDKNCLVIVVAQSCGAAAVHDGQGHYTYPVRRETGIERVSVADIRKTKLHMKSDNHDFMRELNQFVLDT